MSLVRWDRIPAEFHYLRDAIEACGETRICQSDATTECHRSFLGSATQEQLQLIRTAKDEVESRGERASIEQWCEAPAQLRPSVRAAIWHIQGMLMLFDQLEDNHVVDFDGDGSYR